MHSDDTYNCSTSRTITLVVHFHIVGNHTCMLYLIENSVLCSVQIWKKSLGLTCEQICIYFAGKQTFSYPDRGMHFNIICM